MGEIEIAGEIETKQIRTNGITLNVAVAGPDDGPLLILLHGFPETWRAWEAYLPVFAQAGFRVLAPDQRGYGDSDKPQDVAAYRPELLMADVVGLIDACGRQHAHVVGHDWGAFVAWSLALHHADRLAKLVVLNVPHPYVMGRRLRTDPRQMLRSWYIGLFALPRVPELLLQWHHHRLLAWLLTSTSRKNAFRPALLQHYQEAWDQPGAITGMLNWYRAAASTLRSVGARPAARVHVPTLILWGERDVALVPEAGRDSAALCDDVRLQRYPHCTHWLHHEEPQEVQRHILNFLARQ